MKVFFLREIMPPSNVVWLESYCFCSVCLCVRLETLLTRYLAEYLTDFHQTYSNDPLWTEMNAFHFGVKRSVVKVIVEYNMMETAFLVFTTPLGGGVQYSTTWRQVIFI